MPRLLLRLLLILLGLAAWFATQHLIGARPYTGAIGDGLLDLLAPLNRYLLAHAAARNALLISSSALIDALTLFLFAKALFGKTLRPFLGLLMLFALRQICQALCVLPTPPDMIWPKEGPGFPSLFVTYGVGNDLFFSGHTALAIFGASELVRTRRWLWPAATVVAIFEIVAVLSLRAHWTMDVYAGAVTALLVAIIADDVARPIDRMLSRIAPGKTVR
ncbi:MAG TPA: phosphatase PAP2-related protein [Phycisphaerae bacterium]|nr:phosphatase PAP2-related protein [Phycisphaerae bacterium]